MENNLFELAKEEKMAFGFALVILQNPNFPDEYIDW
jgi:hypothetical protein